MTRKPLADSAATLESKPAVRGATSPIVRLRSVDFATEVGSDSKTESELAGQFLDIDFPFKSERLRTLILSAFRCKVNTE